jgi:hypothetical protein
MNVDPLRYCQHATCRAHTAEELLYMGARLDRKDLQLAAREALRATVRCRHQPRKGPIHAPLPPRGATA